MFEMGTEKEKEKNCKSEELNASEALLSGLTVMLIFLSLHSFNVACLCARMSVASVGRLKGWGAEVIWRITHSHIWWLMLAVGKDIC